MSQSLQVSRASQAAVNRFDLCSPLKIARNPSFVGHPASAQQLSVRSTQGKPSHGKNDPTDKSPPHPPPPLPHCRHLAALPLPRPCHNRNGDFSRRHTPLPPLPHSNHHSDPPLPYALPQSERRLQSPTPLPATLSEPLRSNPVSRSTECLAVRRPLPCRLSRQFHLAAPEKFFEKIHPPRNFALTPGYNLSSDL